MQVVVTLAAKNLARFSRRHEVFDPPKAHP
jgi:hypothetical protein